MGVCNNIVFYYFETNRLTLSLYHIVVMIPNSYVYIGVILTYHYHTCQYTLLETAYRLHSAHSLQLRTASGFVTWVHKKKRGLCRMGCVMCIHLDVSYTNGYRERVIREMR